MTTTLTRTERRLRKEIREIAIHAEMDVWNIELYRPGPTRRDNLRVMKDKFIRGEVIIRYALLDEFLTDIICDYYFRRPKGASFRGLWRTKHFKVFMHYLMDETFLLKKLAMVEAIKAVPVEVSKAIRRINDIRNALAHSIFPEQRRRYMPDGKVLYQGVDSSRLRAL